MVGCIISVRVTFMPFATEVTDWTASVSLEAIRYRHYRRSAPDLILGGSAGLPFRHALFRPEGLDAGALAQRFQLPLGKSAERFADLAVRLHHKQRRDGGDPEAIAGRIIL